MTRQNSVPRIGLVDCRCLPVILIVDWQLLLQNCWFGSRATWRDGLIALPPLEAGLPWKKRDSVLKEVIACISKTRGGRRKGD